MSIFLRPWLAPSPPVVFDALSIGVAFLVNIGYGGPVAEPGKKGMTCPSIHVWPPRGISEQTPRLHIIRYVMQSAPGLEAEKVEELGSTIEMLSKRKEDGVFVRDFDGVTDEPLQSDGVCLAPGLVAGDEIVERPGETIRTGDFAAVVLRGTLVPLVKVFAGVIDRGGVPSALFYLRQPEQLIEVRLSDVLFARKVAAPRQHDGSALLAAADPFVVKWRTKYGIADEIEPVGTTRTAAWVESMRAVFAVLRKQPA